MANGENRQSYDENACVHLDSVYGGVDPIPLSTPGAADRSSS